jgi:hypothetical protein
MGKRCSNLRARIRNRRLRGAGSKLGAQQQTWKGMISDSMCGGDHGGEVDVVECTQKCIKQGDKYVLATNNGAKVVPIANQDFAQLAANAGKIVNVTGELKNGAIVIAKIAVAP